MTRPVLPLAEAREAAVAGGKGASLGELIRAGAAVPPGFVVTTGAFAAVLGALDVGGPRPGSGRRPEAPSRRPRPRAVRKPL